MAIRNRVIVILRIFPWRRVWEIRVKSVDRELSVYFTNSSSTRYDYNHSGKEGRSSSHIRSKDEVFQKLEGEMKI